MTERLSDEILQQYAGANYDMCKMAIELIELRAKVAELEGHIAHADAYHAAMEKAETERDALRERVAQLADKA